MPPRRLPPSQLRTSGSIFAQLWVAGGEGGGVWLEPDPLLLPCSGADPAAGWDVRGGRGR